jgi:uncharacterized protein (TIGR02145 family)
MSHQRPQPSLATRRSRILSVFMIAAMVLLILGLSATERAVAQSCCTVRGNVDCDPDGIIDISDLSRLIDYMFISLTSLCCDSAGNADGDPEGIIDISDLSFLIDYMFINFTPLPPCAGTVTDIDGNVYQTVTIGTQVWMKENLKVTHYRNGDAIPNVTGNTTWYNLGFASTGAYCEYSNDAANVATYGRLYNWYAAVDSRNIAPAGWHVPTDAEWKQLEMYLGMSQAEADVIGDWRGTYEGGKLKESGTAHWFSPNTGATNESGFSALPGGTRFDNGTYYYIGDLAHFWSSTEGGSGNARFRSLQFNKSRVYYGSDYMQSGLSVRCVRDVAAVVPVLTTASVSGITETTAECGGIITSDDGAAVTARGVCWSTNPTPTVADSKSSDGAGTGSFASSIIGLTGNTPYYVRAYATSSVGTGYGSAVPFTTAPAILPVLTTASVSGITETTAECGGTITSDRGATVTARGVCWSMNATPTIANSKTTDGIGMGSFTSSITGLLDSMTYYVRAYATNSAGTGYGNTQSFTTESSSGTVTDIDGNVYQTVTIGTQVWMAANLKVTHYRNGEDIPNVTNAAAWAALTTGGYCNYNNDVNNVATYGSLYNWYATVDSLNIAPTGWHVPTDAEWQTLSDFLGGDAVAGGKMKEAGTTHWVSPNTGATNESGFSALPGGFRDNGGACYGMSYSTRFWSATESSSSYAWDRSVGCYGSGISRGSDGKKEGFSVRCVRD